MQTPDRALAASTRPRQPTATGSLTGRHLLSLPVIVQSSTCVAGALMVARVRVVVFTAIAMLAGCGGAEPDTPAADTRAASAVFTRECVREAGTVTIAVPILRDDGILGVLGVTGPEERCGLAWVKRVSRLLPEAARAIVDNL